MSALSAQMAPGHARAAEELRTAGDAGAASALGRSTDGRGGGARRRSWCAHHAPVPMAMTEPLASSALAETRRTYRRAGSRGRSRSHRWRDGRGWEGGRSRRRERRRLPVAKLALQESTRRDGDRLPMVFAAGLTAMFLGSSVSPLGVLTNDAAAAAQPPAPTPHEIDVDLRSARRSRSRSKSEPGPTGRSAARLAGTTSKPPWARLSCLLTPTDRKRGDASKRTCLPGRPRQPPRSPALGPPRQDLSRGRAGPRALRRRPPVTPPRVRIPSGAVSRSCARTPQGFERHLVNELLGRAVAQVSATVEALEGARARPSTGSTAVLTAPGRGGKGQRDEPGERSLGLDVAPRAASIRSIVGQAGGR